jgi:hypothetical protein
MRACRGMVAAEKSKELQASHEKTGRILKQIPLTIIIVWTLAIASTVFVIL